MNQFQTFEEVLSALRRRAWLVLLVAFIGSVLSVVYAMQQVKLYEAIAVVQIEDSSVPDQLAGASAATQDAARRVRLIEQRLMARDNLVRIMEKHDLFSDDPELSMNERIFRMRQSARIEEIINQAQVWQPNVRPSGLLITVTLDDPQKAADLANELMYSVIDQSRSRSFDRVRGTLDFFSIEERRVAEDIEKLESEIAEFKGINAEALPEGLASLREQLVAIREAELEFDQQIVALDTNASRARENVLSRQIALIEEQKRLLSERREQIETILARAPDVERDLGRLQRELTGLQEQYAVVTRRKAEAAMGQLLEDRQQTDRFEVLETALVPEHPVTRSRRQLALMGGVASLLAGLAAAFLIEMMNPAIRNAAQMERVLGIQPVVSIPRITTTRDKRRHSALVIGTVLAGLAVLWGAARFAGDRLPFTELLARLLPGLTRY
ncbi:chain-length determining protein [Thalassococcus sp. CAU 1522]|uniref:Chain-length determining protein n=1 Tax=Thalassococcus arenae TaxID=2851652 RepID=A0ABS6N6Y0_9RHOB|nr:Wzz/FepE/Etk N-terminal domain-containing protein [Thalassococcus arenae]MBV2359548.1 chain-length determining protein [Thalassococcus arenae]